MRAHHVLKVQSTFISADSQKVQRDMVSKLTWLKNLPDAKRTKLGSVCSCFFYTWFDLVWAQCGNHKNFLLLLFRKINSRFGSLDEIHFTKFLWTNKLCIRVMFRISTMLKKHFSPYPSKAFSYDDICIWNIFKHELTKEVDQQIDRGLEVNLMTRYLSS